TREHKLAPPLTDSQDSTDAKVASLCSLTDKGKRACAENPNLSSYCKLSTEQQERACADSCLKYPAKPYCNINALQNEHENSDRKQDKPQSSGWSTKTWVIGSVVVGILVVAVIGVVVYIRGGRAFDKMPPVDRIINDDYSPSVRFHMLANNLFRHMRYGFKPSPFPLLEEKLLKDGKDKAIAPMTLKSREVVEGFLAKDPKGFPYDPIDVEYYMNNFSGRLNYLSRLQNNVYFIHNNRLIDNLTLPETREDAVQEIEVIAGQQKLMGDLRTDAKENHSEISPFTRSAAMFKGVEKEYLERRRRLLFAALESSYYPTLE
ncbi:MAG: hypothetical protein LE168_03205, partial [Endomicrobium sp.]|nr:hypothetical protein [Endomicrobium sp.]